LNPRSFDGRGNYTLGVKEQIIFPEIDYDSIDQVRGLDITITTSAETDAEAFALLEAMGMPFATQGRPKDFGGSSAEDDDAATDAATDSAKEQATAEAPVEDVQAVDFPDDAPAEQASTEAPAEDDEQAADLPAAQADADSDDAAAEQTDAPETEESADTAEKESTD
jgi:hypothetical protein